MRPLKILTLTVAAALLAAAPAAADAPKDLDAAFKDKAGKILVYARAHGAKNIGVLKFLVRTGDGPLDDNAGPLNLGLARRLTVALILACPDDQIGIIGNANEALANNGRASHREKDGRAACFRGRGFVLAWGDPEIPVKPDLFITGTATLSKDLTQTTIRLQAFGKDGELDESLGEFTVRTTARTLIETGHSYLITRKTNPDLFKGARGGEDDDLDKPAVDLSQKFSAQLKNEPLPSFEHDAPIRVTVYYNDEPTPVKDGVVREPKENEKVSFKIDNVSDEVHGVVLKINGENTIFRERLPDRDCHKWILKPASSVIVRGFQTKLNIREPFKVLTPEASRANEVRYGEFAGAFQITAFRAKSDKPTDAPPPPPPPPPPAQKADQETIAAIARGALKIEGIQPSDLKSLQNELRNRVKSAEGGRGLIDSDTENPQPHLVEKVPFTADPVIPVMSYRIRYYQPANGK